MFACVLLDFPLWVALCVFGAMSVWLIGFGAGVGFPCWFRLMVVCTLCVGWFDLLWLLCLLRDLFRVWFGG